MSFAWSRKVARVVPAPPQSIEVIEAPLAAQVMLDIEVPQTVTIPTVDDKISDIEHTNGEQVADARQEDAEDDEVQGDIQEGGRVEEGDHGGEEALEETRGW